ncbi:MAG: hypothetical protein KJI72_02590 [Patescibacteria group bacterium]|nr:hypothetical protein [Patescibacteria group bacterium]
MAETKLSKKSQGITWRAAEYQYTRKDVGWYWLIALVAVILILLAFWQKNFFFAVFIILAGGMLLFFGRRRPQVLDFRLDDEGIAIGDNIFYDYDRFEEFSIRSRPQRLDEIVLKKKTTINPYIKIPIDSKLALKARAILNDNLTEVEYQESLVDIFSEWFGF